MVGKLAILILSAILISGCIGGPIERTDPPSKPQPSSSSIQEEAASANSQIIGASAPDFELPGTAGDVSLSDLAGQWVVLYFYPKDDTPGCTIEANDFTGSEHKFDALNARVIGVSGDPIASHHEFSERFDISVDLLSDEDHTVMKSYGAWVDASLGDKTYGRVIRSTVLIDPEGIIRYHWPEVIPEGHAERVLEKLKVLQAQQ